MGFLREKAEKIYFYKKHELPIALKKTW